MSDIYFWNECKKTIERDLPVEEYSTWISPLSLKVNGGSKPISYSVVAPNKFILDFQEFNLYKKNAESSVKLGARENITRELINEYKKNI